MRHSKKVKYFWLSSSSSSSSRTLSYDRANSWSKASSPQSATQFFLFKFSVPSCCLQVFQDMLTSSVFSFPPFYPSFCRSFLPSITCFKRHSLHKMWPVHLVFLCFIECRMSLFSFTFCKNLILCTVFATDFHISFPATHFQNFKLFLIYFSKCPSFKSYCSQFHTLLW